MPISDILAAVNACLNATSAVLMASAFVAIRGAATDRPRAIARHRKLMLSAFGVSAVFLMSYLTRMAIAGDTPFRGEGPVRYVYFAILISHVLLAIVVLPFILRSLYLGLKLRYTEHKRVAKITFPMWLYVSVTGVVVYLMLYQWPASSGTP